MGHWEPSANPGDCCYKGKRRRGKPLSSRQAWELSCISPPQGRQAAPMRQELLRDCKLVAVNSRDAWQGQLAR